MKKRIAGMLAAVMLICCIGTALAETFETEIDKFGLSAKEWCSNSTYRAMLTVTMAYEYFTKVENGKEFSLSLMEPSYVARTDNLLTVCLSLLDGSDYVAFLYIPSEKVKNVIVFSTLGTNSNYLIKRLLEDETWEYYENDQEDIVSVLNMMKDTIE